MSAPVKGGHVRVREKALAHVQQFYPVNEEKRYVVAMVDRSPIIGRPRCYVMGDDGATWCFWLSQVKADPRCEYCDKEGHVKSQATAKNCEVVAKELEEKRLAKEKKARAA